MGTSFLVALALAGFGGGEPPDGRLVLSVAGHSARLDAVTREWAAVADPRSGALRKRRLAGGSLCIAPVVARHGHAVFGGYRGRQPVTLRLPLSLRGAATVIARRLPRWTTGRPAAPARIRALLGGYEAFAWSPSRRWVYFTDSEQGVNAWRVGSETVTRLPLEPGGTVMSIDVAAD